MNNFEAFEIQFVGLKTGKHHFDYHIDGAFFELFGYDEFNAVDVDVDLFLEKKPGMLEFLFEIKGSVNVNCDLTNEPFDLPIENRLKLVVKFGRAYSEKSEELLILPQGAYKIEVQQYIYEVLILAVPHKKVHPRVVDGTMKSKILDKLEELSPENGKNHAAETDPRWDKLKELLNEKQA